MSVYMPLLSAVTTAVTGLIIWLIKEHRHDRKSAQSQQNLVERALLAIIRNQLVTSHQGIIARWEVTTAETQNFREMNQLYIELGGNGPASLLSEDLKRVRLVVD